MPPYVRPTHPDEASDGSSTDLTVLIDELSTGLEAVEATLPGKFDKAGGTVSGGVQIDRVGDAAESALVLNGDAGQYRVLKVMTGGEARWVLGAVNNAETGSNAGSDFMLFRYDDDGTYIATALTVVRSTGEVRVPVAPTTTTGVANKAYVDAKVANTLAGTLSTTVAPSQAATDATYVKKSMLTVSTAAPSGTGNGVGHLWIRYAV